MDNLDHTGGEAPLSTSSSAVGVGAKPQVGALCWRPHRRSIEVLLITSRDTGRWVIPKGGLIDGLDAPGSARQEAWEEAGVEGHLQPGEVLGHYDYDKLTRNRTVAKRCRVEVYPLRVERLAADFPEREERRRKWFDPAKAATQVEEAALRRLLKDLARAPQKLTEGTSGRAPGAG